MPAAEVLLLTLLIWEGRAAIKLFGLINYENHNFSVISTTGKCY